MLLCRNPLKRLVLIAFIQILFVHILTAQEEPANEELIFPIVATGIVDSPTHFQSTITFLEMSGTTFEGSIEFFSDRGVRVTSEIFCAGPVGGVVNPNISISGNGLHHRSTIQETDLFTGWGRVVSAESSSINQIQASVEVSQSNGETEGCPVVICNRPSTEILSTTQIPAVRPATEFRAATMINPNRHTAFAIVNPSETETAEVTIQLLDASGETPELLPDINFRVTYELRQQAKFEGFLWQFLFEGCDFGLICGVPPGPPPEPEMFHGSVIITSDIPIAVAAVDVLFPEGKFVNVAVEAR